MKTTEQNQIAGELAKEQERQQLERMRKERESGRVKQEEDIEVSLEKLEQKPEQPEQ